MKQEIYDTALEILSRKSSFQEGFSELQKLHPTIVCTFGEKTLRSIQAQYYVRRMRRCHHHHYSRETREKYYKLYKKAKNRSQKHVITRLASNNDISSCLLARIILEEYFWNEVEHDRKRDRLNGKAALPPGFMTDCIRDLAKIPDPELATEIYETMVLDNFYGPAVDSIKKTCGAEYEIILKNHCVREGLVVRDEEEMREKGYDKTPDIHLKIPVLFKNRVINWIESKASFGDPISHQQYNNDQFLPYKNRFGPGAVIYWFGFVDELAESGDRGILLLDEFPSTRDIQFITDIPLEYTPSDNQPSTRSGCKEVQETDKFATYVDPMFDFDEEDDECFKQVSSSTKEVDRNVAALSSQLDKLGL